MNTVVLSSSFMSAGVNSQNITLVHEALHTGTGKDDIDLATQLGLAPDGGFPRTQAGAAAASASISAWFKYDCIPTH